MACLGALSLESLRQACLRRSLPSLPLSSSGRTLAEALGQGRREGPRASY